jgi:hypothetical protein
MSDDAPPKPKHFGAFTRLQRPGSAPAAPAAAPAASSPHHAAHAVSAGASAHEAAASPPPRPVLLRERLQRGPLAPQPPQPPQPLPPAPSPAAAPQTEAAPKRLLSAQARAPHPTPPDRTDRTDRTPSTDRRLTPDRKPTPDRAPSPSRGPQAAADDEQPILRPGPRARTARTPDGRVLDVPDGWELVPPGDPALTRRLKDGPCWVLQEKVGRKVLSRGLWVPAERVAPIRAALAAERNTESYTRKLDAGRRRRAEAQADYVEDFTATVLTFLAFHPRHADLAQRLAVAISAHATPVGSGTVARTERIPIEQRAEAATIAWMRHQTTAYDRLSIPHIKGMRREVRQQLAAESRRLLSLYRRGEDPSVSCPLRAALDAHDKR